MKPVLQGIRELHKHNILHLDLKVRILILILSVIRDAQLHRGLSLKI